jgi:hypothetical protein
MIKIPINPRVIALSEVLDKEIAAYKAPGKPIGPPNNNPPISEADLIAIKGDVAVAIPNAFAYYIEKLDENKVKAAAQGLFPNSKLISISGRFHYPNKYKDESTGKEYMGFMGWHSNSNAVGWRVYATRCDEGNKSFFRYYNYNDNKMYTEWEEKGWNFRAFQVRKDKLYWHCVYSETDRYSFGFRFALE